MNQLLITILLLFISVKYYSQGVRWTNIEDVKDSVELHKKPIIVKVEAPWCGYCKMMDAKVYSSKRFAKHIGRNYYFVRINAVSEESITFNGKIYDYIPYNETKGIHSLAKELAEVEGVIRYPTTVVLNSNLTFNKRFVGYLNRQDLKYWLQFSEE